jgi:hypothetical protein
MVSREENEEEDTFEGEDGMKSWMSIMRTTNSSWTDG